MNDIKLKHTTRVCLHTKSAKSANFFRFHFSAHMCISHLFIEKHLFIAYLVSEKQGFLGQGKREYSAQIFQISFCFIPLSVKYYIIVFAFEFSE